LELHFGLLVVGVKDVLEVRVMRVRMERYRTMIGEW